MTLRSPDAIVLGTGTMGASACLALARRGVRVLGLDRHSAPHAFGAHHGQSRMFRMSYFEHPDYVPLLRRSLELWRGLEADTRQTLLHLTGGLYLGPADGELVAGSLASAREHGLVHEVLTRTELARRFPQFAVAPDWIGMLERDAGFVVPDRAVGACLGEARRLGADIRANEPVVEWSADDHGVTVRTPRGVYQGGVLVICAGPWSAKAIDGLGVPVTITRQVMGWVRPSDPSVFALGRFPVWAAERDEASIYYGFPMMRGEPGLKTAVHGRGTEADPDHVGREGTAADEALWREGLRRHLPAADGPTLAQVVCMYDNSPDGHFVIDSHPRHRRVIVACGFSGHGFKFAPVIGEALADLASGGRSSLPVGFLAIDRGGNRRAAPHAIIPPHD